jgi:hypothetical protein
MAGAGIRSFAKFRGQMPRIATTGITSWQTALKWTAYCQVPHSGCHGHVKPVAIHSQIHTSVCSNLRDGYSILGNPSSKRRGSHLSMELGKRLNPVLEYKIPSRRIVWA